MSDPRRHDSNDRRKELFTPLIAGALALIPHPALHLGNDFSRPLTKTSTAASFGGPSQEGGNPTADVGNYRVELRIPDGGLYAGEPTDVEFRVADRRRKDPIEGFVGVPDARPAAAVTMPEMAGMPVQRPGIHREGVPGDYGLELFFPHGGTYKIALRLDPVGGKPAYAEFRVDVKDADARRKPVPAPYRVEILDAPKRAGRVRLDLRIVEAKSGDTVRLFDVAHTKTFHLMIARKDLGWFVHEHPVAQPDGTFVWNGTIPHGGDYLVFADVAPKGKGSQVLGTTLNLEGPKVPKSPLVLSRKADVAGIDATLAPGEIPVGRTVALRFVLQDAKGKAIGDLQPYLGARGHLMIVHQDGKSFVHSHPADGPATPGLVEFNARFPRTGIYKAWAQFGRAGRVVTLPFVFRVG